ncbi:MAG: SGNH/GDSL hydrolase family protein [Chloroflexota bacterium]
MQRWLIPGVAGVLLAWHLAGDVWAMVAHLGYATYLLWLMVLPSLTRRFPTKVPAFVTGTWLAMAAMTIVSVYTPTGWVLWVRLLLLVMTATQTLYLWQEHNRPRLPAALLPIITITITVLLTYTADRTLGLIAGERQPGGLVFPRHSQITYRTTEFTFTARINTHGFRGQDVDLTADAGCRVMLLGDSFTYGWGTDYENTWGALLEQDLQAAGHDAQILNLGAPGANIPDYALIAQQAAPLLQPDVIVVGVLQGDDMRQMSREAAPFPRLLTFGDAVQPGPLTEYLTFHYPYIAERTVLSRTGASAVQRNWQATAMQFVTDWQARREWQARYNTLPETIRKPFLSGELSPHFVQFAVVMPDYWLWPLQPPETLSPYITQMTADFEQIANSAPDADILVASVPHGAYTQPRAQADLRAYGFDVPDELLQVSQVDDAIAQAATQADVDFISVTDAFRQSNTLAFYPLDGHFNNHGNRLFASALLPAIAERCP